MAVKLHVLSCCCCPSSISQGCQLYQPPYMHPTPRPLWSCWDTACMLAENMLGSVDASTLLHCIRASHLSLLGGALPLCWQLQSLLLGVATCIKPLLRSWNAATSLSARWPHRCPTTEHVP